MSEIDLLKKLCQYCGTYFEPRHNGRIYCSDDCQQKEYKKRYKLKYKNVIFNKNGICKTCNNPFIKKQPCQQYCNISCRKSIYIYEKNQKNGRFVIYLRDNFKCFYCGKSSFKDNKELNLEHILPKIQGGKDIANNLVTSCIRCNSEKSTILINDTLLKEMQEEIRYRNKINDIHNERIIKLYTKLD